MDLDTSYNVQLEILGKASYLMSNLLKIGLKGTSQPILPEPLKKLSVRCLRAVATTSY